MKYLHVLLLSLISLLPACVAEEPATEPTIRELMAVMQSEKLIDSMYAQIDSMMEGSMKQATAGHPLNAEQAKIMDDMRTKMMALLREQMDWKSFEPIMIDIYRKSFTEQEVRSMLTFYQSPAGKSVIAKMPLAMQASMQAAQSRMSTLMPKLQELSKDTSLRLKAASSKQP